MNLIFIILFCFLNMAYAQVVLPPHQMSMARAEYVLYYEVPVDGNAANAIGPVKSSAPKNSDKKMFVKAKDTSPVITLRPKNNNKRSFTLTLNGNGVFFGINRICSWRFGKYNSTKAAGQGTYLVGCPSWVPFKTYNRTLTEDNFEVTVVLSIPYSKINGQEITTTFSNGLEFTGLLPVLQNPWKHQASLLSSNLPKIKFLRTEKSFLKFNNDLHDCLKNDKFKQCFTKFIPSLARELKNAKEDSNILYNYKGHTIWNNNVATSPIICPHNQQFKNLSTQDYLECLAQNSAIQDEIRQCFVSLQNDHALVQFQDDLAGEFNQKKIESLFSDVKQELKIDLSGTYFNCRVQRFGGKWYLSALHPHFMKIKQMQADGILKIQGDNAWPFIKTIPQPPELPKK